MKDIIIKTIPPEEQRYDTAGDYWETDTEIHFRISKQKIEQSEVAILLHEITEFFLTKQHGITEPEIMAYDLAWDEKLNKGETIADEPGSEPGCIYADEHNIALIIERIFCMAAGINWNEHDDQLISRQDAKSKP